MERSLSQVTVAVREYAHHLPSQRTLERKSSHAMLMCLLGEKVLLHIWGEVAAAEKIRERRVESRAHNLLPFFLARPREEFEEVLEALHRATFGKDRQH